MKIFTTLVSLSAVLAVTSPAWAQYDAPVADLYELVTRQGSDFVDSDEAVVYETMAARTPVTVLKRGERVHRLRQTGGWTRVRTAHGAVGFVRTEDLSDRWLFVSKNQHMMYLYEGIDLILKVPIDLSVYYVGDKSRRGSYRNPEDWRTPEGMFYITWKRNTSSFYKALVLSYPGPGHASRGLREGVISRENFARIVKANQVLETPPMNTLLGGWIEIHGHGVDGRANWTRGCVAVENADIDLLWPYVEEGMPVLIGKYTRDRARTAPQIIAHRLPAGKPLTPGAMPAGAVNSDRSQPPGTK